MGDGMRYFYAQAAMDKYYIIDKEDETILAICETQNYAERIVGALNFNNLPDEYGFGPQTVEENQGFQEKTD